MFFYGRDEGIPAVQPEASVPTATFADGMAAGGPFGAVRDGRGRTAGLVCDPRALPGEGPARDAAVPPADDDVVADLWILRGGGVVSEDREEDLRGCRVPCHRRWRAPRPQPDQRVQTSAPGRVGGAFHAGTGAGEEGAPGQARERRLGRDEDEGERVEAQGDEL